MRIGRRAYAGGTRTAGRIPRRESSCSHWPREACAHSRGSALPPAPAAGRRCSNATLELERLAEALRRRARGRGSIGRLRRRRPPDWASRAARRRRPARARATGWSSLSAAGRELERDFTFGVALQLFETRVTGARRTTRPPGCSPVAPAWPARCSAPARAPRCPTRARRSRSSRPLLALREPRRRRRRWRCSIDDLHWADPASRRFVLYLAHRLAELPDLPGRLAADLRAHERERRELAELAAEPACQTLALEPLDPAAVLAAVRAALGRSEDALRPRVLPGDARQPLPGPRAGCASSRSPASSRQRPTPPRSALAARRERRALGRAAPRAPRSRRRPRSRAPPPMLGDGAEPRHAALLAGLDEQLVSPLVDALASAGILRRAERLAFERAAGRAGSSRRR